MQKTFIALVVFPIILCFGFTRVYAKDTINELFNDAPYSADLYIGQERAKEVPTIVRSRHVLVNFNYLAEKDFPQGAGAIVMNLFHDVSFIAVKERVEKRSVKQYTWFGRIEGVEHGHVILVVENSSMVGNITAGGRVYQIRSVGKGVHAIYEIDQSAFPEDAPPIPIETPDSSDLILSVLQADDGPVIDVMVVYTNDAANASGNIASEIQLAIDETNQSYKNSSINQRLRLVHSAQVSYTETGDMYADLNCISSKIDGCLDEIHTWRDMYGADVVSLWVEDGGAYCGMAWLMRTVSTFFESWAFSVVERSCATGIYAFGHEIGHNMGAHHDRYVTTRLDSNDQGAYAYSHGYVYTPGRWRTIMAYNTECSDNGFYCTILPYWSNPDELYGGVPMGIPEGQADAADNRKTLNNTADTVANFRESGQYPRVTLLSPNGGEAIPSGSIYTIQWEAPPEAVKFDLQYSKNNGATWELIENNVTGTSYDWSMPTPMKNKENCLVKVIGYDASDIKVGKDKSDATFTIEVIRVISPNGEESLTSGSIHTITWQTGTVIAVANVKLLYTKNGEATWKLIEKIKGSNPGSFDWIVPTVIDEKTQCKVKVVLMDANNEIIGKDKSDSYFTIYPSGGGCTSCHF
jgi:hypothetical protein